VGGRGERVVLGCGEERSVRVGGGVGERGGWAAVVGGRGVWIA